MAKKEKDNNEQEKWLITPTSIRLKDAGHGEMRSSYNFSKKFYMYIKPVKPVHYAILKGRV